MNAKTLSSLLYMPLCIIKVAAVSIQCKKVHLSWFVENLTEDNQAHIDYQKYKSNVTYTTFYQANRELSVKNFLSLYRTLYGETNRIKRLTIITIRVRNGYRTDDAGINHVNFITAMQKLLTNEIVSTVVSNNLIVTVNHIKKDRIPDFDLLVTTNNTIKSIYSKLICLFTDSIIDILCGIFKKHMIDEMYSFAHWLAENHIRCTNFESPENYFERVNYNLMQTLRQSFAYFEIKYQLSIISSVHKAILADIRTNILAFEQEIQFKYFTSNIEKLNKTLDCFFEYFYSDVFRDVMNNLIPAGLKFVGQQKHMQMHKAAFAGGCRVIIRYMKSKMRTRNLRGNPDDQDDESFVSYARHFALFNDHFYDFFEAINFDQIKIGLCELHAARFQKLKQELELPCTRIIFNGEMSIKNLPLINDALLASKVFKDLNVTQTLYIEKDRVIGDETKLQGDSKYSKKSFSSTKSHKYTVDANEIVEVFTKTKDAKLEPRSCTKETKTNDALNKISIVAYTKQIPIKKGHSTICLLVDDIMKVNNSKYGSLHKITIACKSNLTHIHIFYHTSNRSNVERITVFCDTLDLNQKDVTTTEASKMLCLDNIPNSILDDLYMNLCVLQYTNAPVFVFPNVWTTQQSQITYADRVVSSGDLLRNTRIAYSKYFKSYNQDDSYSMPYCDSMNRLMNTYKHGSKFDASLKHFFKRFLGLTKADFDQIICKSVFNMDSFGPKVDDPFILDDHRTTQEVQFYAMQPNEQTIILYVVVRRDVYDMINMFNHGINFLEKFLGDESYKSTFSNYTEIEKYLGMDKKLFTLILNDLSKLGFFDSIAQECEITEKSYKLDLLSRLDSLFDKNEHRGQGDNDSKLPPKSLFALALEPLIELDIDEMIKTIFEEKKKLMPQAKAKISYFKIVKTGKNSEVDSTEVAKDEGKMEYRNLEHLDIEVEYEKEKVRKLSKCAICDNILSSPLRQINN